jgi:uncharacterized iron-regulated membrane protein
MEFVERHVDPRTGQAIEPQGTLAGTGFIFPFHFGLHIRWMDVGYWLVFLVGMALLVLLVSGVIIHRPIFKDLFAFRPAGALSRSSLDLHNVTGELLLPFHLVMTLSGLIIFFSSFFPGTWQAVYGDDQKAFHRDVFGDYQRPGPTASASSGPWTPWWPRPSGAGASVGSPAWRSTTTGTSPATSRYADPTPTAWR